MRPADLARRAASTARLAVLALTPPRVLRAQYERRGREVAAYASVPLLDPRPGQHRRGASEHRNGPLRRVGYKVATAEAMRGEMRDQLARVERVRDALTIDLNTMERERDAAVQLSQRTQASNRDYHEAITKACAQRDAADARATAERARADRLHAALNDATTLVGALLARHTVAGSDGRRTWRPQQVPDAVVTEWAAEHDRLGMVARDGAPPVGAETEEVARG